MFSQLRVGAAVLGAVALLAVGARAAEPIPDSLRYGLVPLAEVRANRPLVVLVHGLNSDHGCFDELTPLLRKANLQVAWFDYPNDQPLAASGALLTRHLHRLRAAQPGLRVNLVSHSMGALVARAYVEGAEYRGGVERLVMLAPPNQGSSCAKLSFCTEWAEHWNLARREPNWSFRWMHADGRGEAAGEILPDSQFLAELNTRPRRAEVRYTIVAGNRHLACRYGANLVQYAAGQLPESVRYSRQAKVAATLAAGRLRQRECESDGIVDLSSARLAGVEDVVIVPADHTTILRAEGELPPAAWPPLAARLAPAAPSGE